MKCYNALQVVRNTARLLHIEIENLNKSRSSKIVKEKCVCFCDINSSNPTVLCRALNELEIGLGT